MRKSLTLAYSTPAYGYPAQKLLQASTVILLTLVNEAVRRVLEEVESLYTYR
jgi:hypothetical protein